MTEVEQLADGVGLGLDVDGSRPLPVLTAALNGLCDAVEERAEPGVVSLRLVPTQSREWPTDVTIQQVSRWERAVRRLERLPAMSIAVATGTCGGPALDVLLSTDFRIGTPDLLLLLPVNDRHLWPGMAVYRLVHHLGLARARRLILWGDSVTAVRAEELGLVDQVVEELSEAVHTATMMLGRISDEELAIRRDLMIEATSTSFDEALGAHLAACERELRRLRPAGGTDVDRT